MDPSGGGDGGGAAIPMKPSGGGGGGGARAPLYAPPLARGDRRRVQWPPPAPALKID